MQRLRRSVRSRWISPGLMLRHRIRGAEFFRASFTTNRGIACSKMPLQTQSHLRGRQSDRRCGRRKEKIKHRSCPGTRASRLTRMRRCLRDRRPSLIEPPACNRVKGRALRPALRPRQLKLPAVRRCSQRQNEGKSCLRLGTTSEPSICPTTKLPRWGWTLRPRFLRGATLSPLKVESEPSWLATSSAISSNPASVGSGGCSRRDDEAPHPRCSWWSIPDPSRRKPSRSALTFKRSTPAVLSARTADGAHCHKRIIVSWA